MTVFSARRWMIVAGSCEGVQHQQHALGNQDAYALASRVSGGLILAVADGAGSAKHAAQGARITVEQSIHYLSQMALGTLTPETWQQCAQDTLTHVQAYLRQYANEQQESSNAYAATLLVAFITPEHTAVLQIGDGAIVVKTPETPDTPALTLLTQPFHGEHASETIFVTSQNCLKHLSTSVIPAQHTHALALLTDGLESVALSYGVPFEGFFEPLFAFAANPAKSLGTKCAELRAFLASGRVNARSYDDKTLVLLTREPVAPVPEGA